MYTFLLQGTKLIQIFWLYSYFHTGYYAHRIIDSFKLPANYKLSNDEKVFVNLFCKIHQNCSNYAFPFLASENLLKLRFFEVRVLVDMHLTLTKSCSKDELFNSNTRYISIYFSRVQLCSLWISSRCLRVERCRSKLSRIYLTYKTNIRLI